MTARLCKSGMLKGFGRISLLHRNAAPYGPQGYARVKSFRILLAFHSCIALRSIWSGISPRRGTKGENLHSYLHSFTFIKYNSHVYSYLQATTKDLKSFWSPKGVA